MSYEGRSPMKDVARSVVMGAAMISPALLEACAKTDGTPPVRPDPTTHPIDSTTSTVATTAPSTSTEPTDTIAAPPTTTVRPRPDPTMTNMPTRGFSGAARARA